MGLSKNNLLPESDRRYLNVLEYHLKPISHLFSDGNVTDIVINEDSTIFAYALDGITQQIEAYVDPKSIAAVASLLAARTQNDVNEDNPSVQAQWPDPPMRISIILPPAASVPCMTIRRFSPVVYPLSYFLETGSCTEEQYETMRTLILSRKNIVLSGETGSGKTTLLASLLAEIPEHDRLFIIEDTKEIRCNHLNKTMILTGEKYSARSAVRDSLRFRPDRIIIGEVRDGAALDLLKAWNTGHPGGLCSVHANGPDTVKQRFRDLIQEVSLSSQDALIDMTLDAVIHMALCPDGKRRVTEIREFHKGEKYA